MGLSECQDAICCRNFELAFLFSIIFILPCLSVSSLFSSSTIHFSPETPVYSLTLLTQFARLLSLPAKSVHQSLSCRTAENKVHDIDFLCERKKCQYTRKYTQTHTHTLLLLPFLPSHPHACVCAHVFVCINVHAHVCVWMSVCMCM